MRAVHWIRRWNAGLAGVVVAAAAAAGGVFPSPAAVAQASAVGEGAGQQVVERCLGEMRETVRKTAGLIGVASKRAIGTIAKLDEKGAPDAMVVRAANNGLDAVRIAADRGHERVNGVAFRCTKALEKIGAPEGAFEAVRAGAAAAHEAIHGHASAAREAIAGALEAALGSDDGDGDGETPA